MSCFFYSVVSSIVVCCFYCYKMCCLYSVVVYYKQLYINLMWYFYSVVYYLLKCVVFVYGKMLYTMCLESAVIFCCCLLLLFICRGPTRVNLKQSLWLNFSIDTSAREFGAIEFLSMTNTERQSHLAQQEEREPLHTVPAGFRSEFDGDIVSLCTEGKGEFMYSPSSEALAGHVPDL